MEANSHSTRPAGVAEGRQPSVERALSHGGLPRIGSTESQQHNGPAGDHPRKRLPAKQSSRSFSDLSRCGHRLAAAPGTQQLGGRSGAVRTRTRWVRADPSSQQAASCSAPQAAVWRPCVALHAVRRRARLQRHRRVAHCARFACRMGPGLLSWLFSGACAFAQKRCSAVCRAALHGRRDVRQLGTCLDNAEPFGVTPLISNCVAQRCFALVRVPLISRGARASLGTAL